MSRGPFLRRASSYDELWSQMDYRTLDIPERFNLGVACVDEQDPSRVALGCRQGRLAPLVHLR